MNRSSCENDWVAAADALGGIGLLRRISLGCPWRRVNAIAVDTAVLLCSTYTVRPVSVLRVTLRAPK